MLGKFESKPAIIGLVVLGVGCLLVVILVPLSFGDLEYYEMGFVRNKVTGEVDTSKVYFGGRHSIGVIYDFKTFKSTKFTSRYNRITVFNREKMEIILSCSLQFVLRAEDLHLLHDAYDLQYEPIMALAAGAAIKGAASQYSIDKYRLNRISVAEGMEQAVSDVLDGGCCRKDCTKHYCRPGCKVYSTCAANEKGMYAAIAGFQLRHVDLSASQTAQFLRQVLEQELEDTESFKQLETVTRKRTEELKARIEHLSDEITQNAYSERSLIEKNAGIRAQQMVANATNEGLSIIHKVLNMSDEEQKKRMDYVRTLRNHNSSNLYIGFESMVAYQGGN